MNEIETKVHAAISEIKRLLPTTMSDVEDLDSIRAYTTGLCELLMKSIGSRIIRESKKQ